MRSRYKIDFSPYASGAFWVYRRHWLWGWQHMATCYSLAAAQQAVRNAAGLPEYIA